MRGETKRQLLEKAHSTATLKVYTLRARGVAAKWSVRPSTFDSVDPRRRGGQVGPCWPAGCGRRAPRSASWEPTGHASAIFPRLLPRSCRQMSCTWMIHLLHRMLCVAGSARLDRLSQRWHHCHNDRQVSV